MDMKRLQLIVNFRVLLTRHINYSPCVSQQPFKLRRVMEIRTGTIMNTKMINIIIMVSPL